MPASRLKMVHEGHFRPKNDKKGFFSLTSDMAAWDIEHRCINFRSEGAGVRGPTRVPKKTFLNWPETSSKAIKKIFLGWGPEIRSKSFGSLYTCDIEG